MIRLGRSSMFYVGDKAPAARLGSNTSSAADDSDSSSEDEGFLGVKGPSSMWWVSAPAPQTPAARPAAPHRAPSHTHRTRDAHLSALHTALGALWQARLPEALWPLTVRQGGLLAGSVRDAIAFGLFCDAGAIVFDAVAQLRPPGAHAFAPSSIPTVVRESFCTSQLCYQSVQRRLQNAEDGEPLQALLRQLQGIVGQSEAHNTPSPSASPTASTFAERLLDQLDEERPAAHLQRFFTRLQCPLPSPQALLAHAAPQKAAQLMFEWAVEKAAWPLARHAFASWARLFDAAGPSPFDSHPMLQSPALLLWAERGEARELLVPPLWTPVRLFGVRSNGSAPTHRPWPMAAFLRALWQRADSAQLPERRLALLFQRMAQNGVSFGASFFWACPLRPPVRGPAPTPHRLFSPQTLAQQGIDALMASPGHKPDDSALVIERDPAVHAELMQTIDEWCQAYGVGLPLCATADPHEALARAAGVCVHLGQLQARTLLLRLLARLDEAVGAPILNEAMVAALWRCDEQALACQTLARRQAPWAREVDSPLIPRMLAWAAQQASECVDDVEQAPQLIATEAAARQNGALLFEVLDALYRHRAQGGFYSHTRHVTSVHLEVWQSRRATP